ncbi:hypothetical protein Tco_1059230 [Tanacetum coccineum]
MVEPKVPLKKKDQVALDEEMARNLEAQLQAELIEEERLTRQKEEEANIKIDEHVEAEKDDDLEEEEMKKHMEIVQDEEEMAIDVIPLATKPPMIVEYKIVKEGQKGFYHFE